MPLPTLSLNAFAEKANNRKPLNVVFLGGSLTWGANASDPNTTSWRGLMMRYLQEKYPSTPFTFHDAAIGGTGSLLGMFRLERDVLPYEPDLVFLDYTVNDDLNGKDIQPLASYEAILRILLGAGCMVVPVLLPVKKCVEIPGDPLPSRYTGHLELARAYKLPAIRVIEQVRNRIKNGLNPDQLWNIGKDKTHPGDEGYSLFFGIIRDDFERHLLEANSALVPVQSFFENLYPKRKRNLLVNSPLPQGWTRAKTYRTSLWFDALPGRWMDDMISAAPANKPVPLEISFEGSMVGIFGQRDGLTPPVRIRIDGQVLKSTKADKGTLWKLDTSDHAPVKKGTGNLYLWQLLSKDLADGSHTLRIEPDFSHADPDAEFHIESICSAGR